MYYLRARYYNPDLGRFISRDPVDISDDVNLYAYVGNSSILYVDLNGKAKEFVDAYDNYLELKHLIYNKGDLDPRFYYLDKNLQISLKDRYKKAFTEARGLHYSRNNLNIDLPNDINIAEKKLNELSLLKSWFHQHTADISSPNRKFLSKDGKKEVIFDSEGNKVTNELDIGTYNFFDPISEPALHKKYDVDPYFEFGNGYNDTTTPLNRMLGF